MKNLSTMLLLAAVAACGEPLDGNLGESTHAACSTGRIQLLGAQASSVNYDPGENAQKATDWSLSTYWRSKTECTGQWISAEVPGATGGTFDHVVLRWDKVSSQFSSDYDLQISNDRTAWTTIASKTGAPSGAASDHDFAFAPVSARYLRASFRTCAGGKTTKVSPYAFSLAELEVYGTTCTADPTCGDGIQNGNETGVDCGGSCPACPTSGCNTGLYAGTAGSCFATAAWLEDFASAGSVNIGAKDQDAGTRWTVSHDATWPDNRCVSKKSNVVVENGEAVLLLRNEPYTFPSNSWSYYEQKSLSGTKDCTNSELRHRSELGPYGFLEARLRTPVYTGYIAGIFGFNFDEDLSPDTDHVAASGYKNPWLEFDHELTGNKPSETLNGLISARAGCDLFGCTWNDQTWSPLGFNHQGSYHTYGLGWTPTELTYWVDGRKIHTLTKASVDAARATDPDAIYPTEPLTMIFNFWVFNTTRSTTNTFGGKYNLADFPAAAGARNPEREVHIDWVRWYGYTP
jgi:hypothetical protein